MRLKVGIPAVTAQQNSYSSQPVVARSQVIAQYCKSKCRIKSETNLLGYHFLFFQNAAFTADSPPADQVL